MTFPIDDSEYADNPILWRQSHYAIEMTERATRRASDASAIWHEVRRHRRRNTTTWRTSYRENEASRPWSHEIDIRIELYGKNRRSPSSAKYSRQHVEAKWKYQQWPCSRPIKSDEAISRRRENIAPSKWQTENEEVVRRHLPIA